MPYDLLPGFRVGPVAVTRLLPGTVVVPPVLKRVPRYEPGSPTVYRLPQLLAGLRGATDCTIGVEMGASVITGVGTVVTTTGSCVGGM